jgi:hypothetical protein
VAGAAHKFLSPIFLKKNNQKIAYFRGFLRTNPEA